LIFPSEFPFGGIISKTGSVWQTQLGDDDSIVESKVTLRLIAIGSTAIFGIISAVIRNVPEIVIVSGMAAKALK